MEGPWIRLPLYVGHWARCCPLCILSLWYCCADTLQERALWRLVVSISFCWYHSMPLGGQYLSIFTCSFGRIVDVLVDLAPQQPGDLLGCTIGFRRPRWLLGYLSVVSFDDDAIGGSICICFVPHLGIGQKISLSGLCRTAATLLSSKESCITRILAALGHPILSLSELYTSSGFRLASSNLRQWLISHRAVNQPNLEISHLLILHKLKHLHISLCYTRILFDSSAHRMRQACLVLFQKLALTLSPWSF